MPFVKLQSGEEILLTTSDIPEPPPSLYHSNPYLEKDPLFKKYMSAQRAQ